MRKRSPIAMLLVCAAAGVACSEDFEAGVGPEPPPVFSLLEVRPTDLALAAVAPGNAVQLTLWAYDQFGEPMDDTGAAAYSSSAPGIAGVSSSGVVTAAAPGSAEITVSLTLGGVTRTAFTTVTVHARDYSDIAGVYDLAALITSSGGWGYEGYRYTAVLTLEEESDPLWSGGTYTDLRLIGPGGDSLDVAHTGVVTGSIDISGRVVLQLLGDGNRIYLTLTVGTVAPGFIDGSFGCCDNFGGTFTAERRQAK